MVFGELPKTSTGKIQKFVLREKAKSTAAIDYMSAVPKSDQPVLLREDRDGICTLTFNRPQQMNLLTGEMLSALQKAVRCHQERSRTSAWSFSPPPARASPPATT